MPKAFEDHWHIIVQRKLARGMPHNILKAQFSGSNAVMRHFIASSRFRGWGKATGMFSESYARTQRLKHSVDPQRL